MNRNVKGLFIEELETRIAPSLAIRIIPADEAALANADGNAAFQNYATTLAIGEETGGWGGCHPAGDDLMVCTL